MSAPQLQSETPPANHRTLRQLLSHLKTSKQALANSIDPADLDAPVHDFSWFAPEPLPLSSHSPESRHYLSTSHNLPIFARVCTDDLFRLSLQSCVTHRGLPLIVSPSSSVDFCDKLVWIKKWRFLPSLDGWNICADARDITAFPNTSPSETPRNSEPATMHLSAIVRACSQIVIYKSTSALFLAELTYLKDSHPTAANRYRLRPVDRSDNTCIVLCVGHAAKWWPRMRQGDQVLITALQPMAIRTNSHVLQTTARSILTTDMVTPEPPAKRQKCAVGASAGALYDDLREKRITRKLFEVVSYEGVVTHASRREIVLDGVVRLPLSRHLGSSLHLFQVGNRLAVSCVFTCPCLHSSLAIIPTVRTTIRVVHVSGESQKIGLGQLPSSENQNLPSTKSRDHFISMYWQNRLSKKLHHLLASLQPDSADLHARFPQDLDLFFSGSDGYGGALELLRKSCGLRDSKETFVDTLDSFINPTSSFEGAVPISIPHLEEVRDLCLKASYSVCTDDAKCIELYQGYQSGGLSVGRTFRFSWTDSTVPCRFFYRKPDCVLIGLLRCTKYLNVYTLGDNSGAASLRCFDRVPPQLVGAVVSLRRYRIIANSWKRDILIVCKARDIQILVNGPNLASPDRKERSHSGRKHSTGDVDQRREFRVSTCLRRIETLPKHSHLTDQTALACLVARKILPICSEPYVVGLVVAKKPKGEPWRYCAEGACSERVGVSFCDSFSGRLAGMLNSGDLFVVSCVSMGQQDQQRKIVVRKRNGNTEPVVMWRLNSSHPFLKVLDEHSGTEEAVSASVLSRIRRDRDLKSVRTLYKKNREGRVCDPLWIAYDAVETNGIDMVAIAGTVEETVGENQSHGLILRLRDSVLGLVGIEIELDRSTSLAGICRGLHVRVTAVRRMARNGAGVAFRGTGETRVELLEHNVSDGRARNPSVTIESVGKLFSYSCLPAGGMERERYVWVPKMVTVRYREIVGFTDGRFSGDCESGSWPDTEDRDQQQAEMVMRVDDGTTEFDLVIGGDVGESIDRSATGRREGPQAEGHGMDTMPNVGGGPVPVLYQLSGERDDGDLFAEEGGNRAFECIELRRHVNLWTCLARTEMRARQLFRGTGAKGSPIEMARCIVSLLENDE
eukprot:GFKZ01013626.1.p1 GENE.GFKZ01013626.1~~GFKZ01013626.1.p1  ORF type:complete len:1129 (-),score=89.28 GFKZ01013626.1:2644-6030(-)